MKLPDNLPQIIKIQSPDHLFLSKSKAGKINTASVYLSFLAHKKDNQTILSDTKIESKCDCKGMKINKKCWHTDELMGNLKNSISSKYFWNHGKNLEWK